MITALTLIMTAAQVVAAVAEQKSPPLSPGPEHRALSVWHGNWNYQSETYATPLGAGSKVTGKMTGRPIQNGFASEFIYEELGPTGNTRYFEIDFWTPASTNYTYIFFGNEGYVEKGSFVMKGDVTTFEGTFAADGKTYQVRGIETIAPDGLSFSKKQELSLDGKTWMPYSAATFTKVSAARKKQK